MFCGPSPKIINISLDTATVPDNLKCAVLDPRLKKETLSTDEFPSYRPISNSNLYQNALCFFFCIVAVHICQLIMDNNLDEALQSAYKVNHSTETAFKIKVQNDILRAIDDGNSVISLL